MVSKAEAATRAMDKAQSDFEAAKEEAIKLIPSPFEGRQFYGLVNEAGNLALRNRLNGQTFFVETDDALALGRWLIDTFEDPDPKAEVRA